MGKRIKNQNILVGSGFLDFFACGSIQGDQCDIEEEAPEAPESNASDEEWGKYLEKLAKYNTKMTKNITETEKKTKEIDNELNKEFQKLKKKTDQMSKVLSQSIGPEIDEEELLAELELIELENLTGGGFIDFFACGSTPKESQEPKASCSPQDLIKNNYKLIRNLIQRNKDITDRLETLETIKPRNLSLYKRHKNLLEKSKQANINKMKLLLKYAKLIAEKNGITPEEQKNLRKQLGGKKRKTGGKRKTKKVRKHRGIVQTGGNKGKLRKGYKYSGKKLKNGKSEIVKCKSKKC